jgi:hypothetical protein
MGTPELFQFARRARSNRVLPRPIGWPFERPLAANMGTSELFQFARRARSNRVLSSPIGWLLERPLAANGKRSNKPRFHFGFDWRPEIHNG